MRQPGNRFQRGSGCFTCIICKRRTRDTGQGYDVQSLRQCAECYEIGGLENAVMDGDSSPETLAEIEKLKQIVISKGGKL